MDYKKVLGKIGGFLAIVGFILMLYCGIWVISLISFILIGVATCLISKSVTRRATSIASFVFAGIALIFNLCMLINFASNDVEHLYVPILCLVFNLLVVGLGVVNLLAKKFSEEGKEINPLIKKLNDLEQR